MSIIDLLLSIISKIFRYLKKPMKYTLEIGLFRDFGGDFFAGEALVLAIHIINYSGATIYIDKIQGICKRKQCFDYKKSLLKFNKKEDIKLEPNQKRTFILPIYKIEEADILFVNTIGQRIKIPYKKICQEIKKYETN